MSNTLSLASRLRSLDDASLVRAIAARELPIVGIKDFFDLADAFLAKASVQLALTRLDRGTLAVLASLGEMGTSTLSQLAAHLGLATSIIRARLHLPHSLLLVQVDGDTVTAYDCVSEQLRSWPTVGLPSLENLLSGDAPAALEPVPDVELRFIDRLASERAFTSTNAVTELLLELEREPARELAKGGIALPDNKRLANAMSVDLNTVMAYLAVAERAMLVCREAGAWLTTELGNSWLLQPTATRWRVLADGWFARLPADIRDLLRSRSHALWSEGLRSYIDWLFPAGGEWMDARVVEYTRDAELLGITANQAPSGPGALMLAGKSAHAEAAMRPLLPAEVEKVYLQHDLSVVAPGPLTPSVDSRLRIIADIENRALAATYRVSTSSVNRALAAGETAHSILSFLREISLTGIPQPLGYLVSEASARYGLVRVGELNGDGSEPGDSMFGARSYLRSEDTNLLDTMAVDQSLSSLSLQRVETHRIVCRFPLDVVFWTLSDARYPVAAENSQGEIVVLERKKVARPVRASFVDPVTELVGRLRAGGQSQDEDGQAWLAKQLDAAIRSKAVLTVSVRMPNGTVVDFQLEPASIAGGRLRALDRKADISRTLPLSSIASVGPPR
ncbi:MAG: hypothetical protein JWP30_917 [Homoserinimonas sp.]|nr:hypothetical protein [Homoserinimonas sp.]